MLQRMNNAPPEVAPLSTLLVVHAYLEDDG